MIARFLRHSAAPSRIRMVEQPSGSGDPELNFGDRVQTVEITEVLEPGWRPAKPIVEGDAEAWRKRGGSFRTC